MGRLGLAFLFSFPLYCSIFTGCSIHFISLGWRTNAKFLMCTHNFIHSICITDPIHGSRVPDPRWKITYQSRWSLLTKSWNLYSPPMTAKLSTALKNQYLSIKPNWLLVSFHQAFYMPNKRFNLLFNSSLNENSIGRHISLKCFFFFFFFLVL